MAETLHDKLILAISSRALFDLDESHQIFENQGIEAYHDYQVTHENDYLNPGTAFPLVKKLLNLKDERGNLRVEVVLLSRNSADTGLRIFNSIEHHNLPIIRAAFTNGQAPYRYIMAFGAHLFLSANPTDVRAALNANCAAATLLTNQGATLADHGEIRIAFDGDAVLFSDEAERVYQQQGLAAFSESERARAREPLPAGPFKPFLMALHQLQNAYPPESCPIRTALVTARSAPAHERVVHTLRTWGIRIDEALFLGGLTKGDFLKAFAADIFFDDQTGHCQQAQVATGHVPHGIMN